MATVLNEGGLAIIPTDTVYGVGASLDHPAAIRRIYTVKSRHSDKPLPILIAREKDVSRYVERVSSEARQLVEAFWPGAMTITFTASENVPVECLSGGSTVGLRIPDHPAVRKLIARCGGGLAVTSANRSGEPETTSAPQAYASLSGNVEIVFDLGRLPGGQPSTVVDLTGASPRILRHGAIDAEEIRAVLATRPAGR